MKKFALITVGFTQPTPEMMDAWMQWFQSMGDKMVDQIGFRHGKEVTSNGASDLPMDQQAITGCVMIQAENMEEAVEIAERCPMVTSTKVYEMISQ